MAPTLSSRLITILSLFVVLPSVCAHTVITYPGWRGNNLISNGTYNETDGLLGGPMNLYPGGMQWQYPCGGLPTGTNRTKWPINGGALAFQPGWFEGHQFALIYINLGQGTEPGNWSLPMVPMFQVQGPSNNAYPDLGVCIPQIGLPANYGTPNVGDNATIQLVMAAQHGAALYSCVDITFAEPEDVNDVNATNCYNSTEIGFNMVITTRSLTSSAAMTSVSWAVPLSLFITLLVALHW